MCNFCSNQNATNQLLQNLFRREVKVQMFYRTNPIYWKLTENSKIITSQGMDVKNYPIEIQALQAQKIALHIQSTHFITLFPIFHFSALTVTAKKNSKNACAKKRNACSSNLGLTSDLQLLEYWNYWPHDLLSKWPRFCRHHSSFQARFDNKSRQVRSWRCDGQ